MLNGAAEVPGQGIAQESEILDMERLIQPPLGQHRLIFGRAGVIIQQHIHRIAGDAGQAKDDDADRKENQQALRQAYDNVALHT